MWRKIKYHPFFIRLLHWEYWPVYVSNIPVFGFWLIHALKARDLFFFSAVNPAIATGGFFGEQKHKIYALIPPEYLPKTMHVTQEEVHRHKLPEKIAGAGFTFPLVCKPDVGERGMHVNIVHDLRELQKYARRIPGDIIVQEYIAYPVELSVMAYRSPMRQEGAVTSICLKSFLCVTGDGQKTLRDLIDENPRAILQKKALGRKLNLQHIPAAGETVLLEAIGNHCRGTQFLNANAWITPQLQQTILDILARMPGIFYGRFDLRTASIEDLAQGRAFQIMEFNGAGSEPAHIYDPGYSIFKAYRDMWKHWKIMYRIFREQKTQGIRTTPWREGLQSLRAYFSYKKKSSLNYSL